MLGSRRGYIWLGGVTGSGGALCAVGLAPKRLLTRELARFFDLDRSLFWEFPVRRRKSVRKEPWESEGIGSEIETRISSEERWPGWPSFEEDDDRRTWRRCL